MAGTLVRVGDDLSGLPSSLGPDLCTRKISGEQTGGALAVFHWHGVTRGGPPLHVHPDQDEVFIVEAGDYRFRCGNEDFDLGPGDTLFLPRGVPHTFAQLSETGALTFMYTPAGDMDAFFAAAAAQNGPPSPEEGVALFAAHNMQVVGPPLAID